VHNKIRDRVIDQSLERGGKDGGIKPNSNILTENPYEDNKDDVGRGR